MNNIITCLLMTFLVVGCSQHSARLSSSDRHAIANIIEQENKGSITEIEPMEDGTVRVLTRVPGENGGGLLTVAKTNNQWTVVLRGSWMN
jgi:hypothetical protein